jgi:prolipoprotein diacylglyceryl transferase
MISAAASVFTSIPSPSVSSFQLGPRTIHFYALCIIHGIIAAVVIGDRRWRARGGDRGTVADVAATAVPAGLVGARLYHVITTPDQYLKDPVEALYVWHGGLGIWGGIAGGALGAWFALRRRGIPFADFCDALAPALPVAQAIGRFGNWFNQELYGKATDLPWGLRIDAAHSPDGAPGTFHPTFLYEALWDLGVALLVVLADRRWKLTRGRAFALYVAAYCAGRAWIEYLRIDEAHRFFGLRLNDYVSGGLFLAAVLYLWLRRPADAVEEAEEPADVPS